MTPHEELTKQIEALAEAFDEARIMAKNIIIYRDGSGYLTDDNDIRITSFRTPSELAGILRGKQ